MSVRRRVAERKAGPYVAFMDLGLRGKRAFVSGSTAGIGFAVAESLAKEGASAVINGRTAPSARAPATGRSPRPGAPRRVSSNLPWQKESDGELWAAYADAFESEPTDGGWSRQAHDSYLPAIQRHLPASSRLESIECRSRFCRVQVIHDTVQVSNSFLMALFGAEQGGALSKTSAGFRAAGPTRTADGKYSSIVYIAGPGVGLALDHEDEAAKVAPGGELADAGSADP